jgi:hypothetical protein
VDVPYLLFPDIDDDSHTGIGSVDGRGRDLLQVEEKRGEGVGNHANEINDEYL